MTNTEMKTVLAQAGVAEADIEKVNGKFDAEKITEIIESASNPKEAFENLHAFYPELEVSELEEQMNFVQDQVEAVMTGKNKDKTFELTEKELEMVSGGGFFSWCKRNWKKIAIGAAVVVGTALICTGVGAAIGACIAGPVVCGTMTSTGAIVAVHAGTMAAAGAVVGAISGTVGGIVGAAVLDKAGYLPESK